MSVIKIDKKFLVLGSVIFLSDISFGAEKSAYLAGGCFWCTEADMEKVVGVIDVVSGYSGGDVINPKYKDVSSGKTGHIESIKVNYDDQKISYFELVNLFLKTIDPTDGDGQFVDRGYQYSPAIFYQTLEEERVAKESLEKIKNEGKFQNIAVKLIPYKNFYDAEEYHQDYYKKNPIRYKYYRNGSGRNQFLEKIWRKESK
ncbi:MAG: peptide-methionine (S)-S-oxide reductase MsrA [Fusobacteriaceae bacterium]